MATTTNYGWTTPDDTALVKDGASAIRTLGSSVDTTTKNLNPETTLGDMSFRSSTSNVNTRIPIGTSGQHLTVVAGVPTWATASDQTPLTTKGDLFTFTTTDARLGVGANNTILTADSAEATGLKWATPAAASFVGTSLYKTGDQSVSTATWTALTWDAEYFDTNTFHDNSSNTSRITIPSGKGGKYSFTFSIATEANATGNRFTRFYKNGSLLKEMSNITPSSAYNNTHLGTYIVDLVATDYIELFVFQSSGGNRPYYGTTDWSNLSATYLGA